MRIVHYYARYLSQSSGVTDAITNWAQQARRLGHDVQVVAARTETVGSDDYLDRGLRLTVAHLGNGRRTWVPIGLLFHLRQHDLLYLHEGWNICHVTAAIIGRLRRAKVIVMPHGVYEPGIVAAMRDKWGLRARLERLTLRLADCVHVFYPSEVDVVRRFAPRTRSFIVVPNGAPPPTADRKWTGHGDYFTWIGRFDVRHKGLDHLVEFWAQLAAPRPRLIMAGPNHDGGREVVERLVRRSGLSDTVEIRGPVSGAEKHRLLTGARGYLHPSRWESCSITLLEFLSTGTPCLVSESLHIAKSLPDRQFLMTADFASADREAARDMVARLDRNRPLGARARDWSDTAGSWSHVGDAYARALASAIGPAS